MKEEIIVILCAKQERPGHVLVASLMKLADLQFLLTGGTGFAGRKGFDTVLLLPVNLQFTS